MARGLYDFLKIELKCPNTFIYVKKKQQKNNFGCLMSYSIRKNVI